MKPIIKNYCDLSDIVDQAIIHFAIIASAYREWPDMAIEPLNKISNLLDERASIGHELDKS